MAGYRNDRISEDIKRELCDIFRDLKDPRVKDKMLSIVHLEVSNDLSFAKVSVSAIEGPEASTEAVKGLSAAAGFIRRELGSRLKIRKVPELKFKASDSIAYGARISKQLEQLIKDNKDNDE
ncbi:MAG: 30S ribosome-binding factor RbfA [Clostridia bacterium]|nr:30S ribosome-binding factor RbfA [Clostridia bacterium]